MAIESPSKLDDEQWLAYWIIYSFLTLLEMVLQPALEWLPIWYEVKLVFVAWLVLPQFKGAAFLYEKYVREQILRHRGGTDNHQSKSPTGKGKNKFVQFMTSKNVSSPLSKKKKEWRAGGLLKKAEKDIHFFFNLCFPFLLSAFSFNLF